MKKVFLIKEKITGYVQRYKKYVLIGGGVALLFVMLIHGYSFLQINYFKMNKNTSAIINVMSKEVTNIKEHQKVYFKTGANYLMEEMSEESQDFFERNLLRLDTDIQEKVLKEYNEKDLFFINHENVLLLAAYEKHPEVLRDYFKRMNESKREIILKEYFGEELKLSQDSVTKLYNIAKLYPAKLPMNHFVLSIYELLSFPHHGSEESMALKLLGLIDSKAIHQLLFKELKTKEVDLEAFEEWIEILHKQSAISTTEYAGFTNSYASITQLKGQYKQAQEQSVEIQNMKQSIDLQTIPFETQIVEANEKIQLLTKEGEEKDKALTSLSSYQTKELYIMDSYGENIYEAAIPEKSWFFNTYKPSDDRVSIKLTQTKPDAQGVYTFSVYSKGEGRYGFPYYEEVSKQQLDQMETLKKEINQLLKEIEALEATIVVAEEEISKLRGSSSYQQNIERLEELETKKENLMSQIQQQQLIIQTLFGIKEVTVEIED